MPLSRKDFLLLLAGTAAAACGGSSNTPPNCAQNGTQADISANHGHTITVSKADIAAGVAKTYDITGSATHSHQVTMTAADFAKLAANNGASEVSTVGDSHNHTVTITCA